MARVFVILIFCSTLVRADPPADLDIPLEDEVLVDTDFLSELDANLHRPDLSAVGRASDRNEPALRWATASLDRLLRDHPVIGGLRLDLLELEYHFLVYTARIEAADPDELEQLVIKAAQHFTYALERVESASAPQEANEWARRSIQILLYGLAASAKVPKDRVKRLELAAIGRLVTGIWLGAVLTVISGVFLVKDGLGWEAFSAVLAAFAMIPYMALTNHRIYGARFVALKERFRELFARRHTENGRVLSLLEIARHLFGSCEVQLDGSRRVSLRD